MDPLTTGAGTPDRTARSARGGVAVLFGVNGATYNSLVPWLPGLRDGLGLSNAELGLAVAAFPAAAIGTGMLAGPLVARVGSGRLAVGVGIVGALLLPLAALAPTGPALAAVLFLLGVTDAWTDAAMNAHGLRVQERYGRSIINGLHAVWSVGAVAAGLAGAAAAGTGVPMVAHLAAVAALLVAASWAAARTLLPGPETDPGADGGNGDGGVGAGLRAAVSSTRTAVPLLAVAGLMVCSAGVEDSSASWGAVYLRDDLLAGPFVAGLPFVAFQAAMTLARLVGDRVVDRLGPVAVARGGALLAATGTGLALALAHPVAAVGGWALAGVGVATLFPLAFAAAGRVPGVPAADGVAVVGWLARAGFLVVPPTIGTLADASSVTTGLLLVPAAALGAAALAGALRPRPARGDPAARAEWDR